jgi:hypothetical protein
MFPGRDTVSTIRAIREMDPPALPPEVPGQLGALVRRLLAKDPGARFATASAVAEALEPYAMVVPAA